MIHNQKIAVAGRSGLGKTFKVNELLRNASQNHVIIYDSQGEFTVGGEYNEPTDSVITQWSDLTHEPPHVIVFDPVLDHEGESGFLEWLMEFRQMRREFLRDHRDDKTRFLVVVDEFDSIASSSACPKELIDTFRVSRRLGIDYLVAAHRFLDVHPRVRSQIKELYQFRTEDRGTIDLLESYGISRDTMQALSAKEEDYAVHYSKIN